MNCENNNMNLHQNTQSIADYLAQLLKDRKQLAAFPNVFNHVERLLDEGEHLKSQSIRYFFFRSIFVFFFFVYRIFLNS